MPEDEKATTSFDCIPQTFDDYLGQHELKKKLKIYAEAAKIRAEALDHILLFGPPGLGKTTLAQILAHEMDVGIKICSGPMLERTGDLVALLTSLSARDIFFIDEIHRMATAVEEVLYSAMEQFRVDIIIGQGAGAKSVNVPLVPFTLLGATTKSGMLSAPLRSRFGIIERLDFYDDVDLQKIVIHNANYLGISITDLGSLAIARSARGTPRIAKKLVRRIRDFAQVNKVTYADDTMVINALRFLGIDQDGLDVRDNALLKTIVENFNGGPVALDTLAAILGEDAETLEEVYEPFLLRKGYLEKTPRGRQIPYKALPYLKSKFCGQQTIMNP
jgi:Holliday junction DNA helicase RuvB